MKAVGLEPEPDWLTLEADKGSEKHLPTAGIQPYGWNDTGNADRLADTYGSDLIYCRERKSYYVWSGTRWEFDEFLEVEKRAEQTMRIAFAEAGAIEDPEKRKAFFASSLLVVGSGDRTTCIGLAFGVDSTAGAARSWGFLA